MKRFRQIFIAVVILLLLFSTVAYGDTWTKRERLSWNAGYSLYPAIAVDGLNIYVVWQDETPGNNEIYFKKSDNAGATWTTKKNLSNTVHSSVYPVIAVDGSNIYVVWAEYTVGNPEIYFKKSDDGGATWTTERLTDNAGYSNDPAIAVDGQSIYVVWQDDSPGNSEIYFKKSDDGGTTWTINKRITWTAHRSHSPAIAIDGSNIYVVWQDDNSPGNSEIYFKKSDDGGTTWTTERLTDNAGYSNDPAIAVDGSNIYVVWEDSTPGNPEIYFKKSVDGGVTWIKNKRLTNTAGYSWYPAIAVDGSNIYVVWEDETPGNPEIYFKKSVDGGVTWIKNKRLTWNAVDAGLYLYPSIAVDGSNIYVVWQDETLGDYYYIYEIFFKKGILY
jgi:hypothetical protein